MPDSSDYRLYLESEFEGLHKLMNAQFDTVHDRLEKIELQTTKTNGRVTSLEKEFLMHPINCNQAKEIEIIKNKVEEISIEKNIGKEKKTEKRAEWIKWAQTIGIMIAAIGLILTAYFGFRGNKNQNTIMVKQDSIKFEQFNMSIPMVVNKRGELIALPDSSKIKFFNNDSIKVLIKRVKK